jgi:hypothetical protein
VHERYGPYPGARLRLIVGHLLMQGPCSNPIDDSVEIPYVSIFGKHLLSSLDLEQSICIIMLRALLVSLEAI